MMLISTAHAAATEAAQTAAPGGGGISELAMLFFFIAIFYFLLIRPQSKRQKAQRELISNLQKGDEVVTSGGVLGRIADLKDDFISPDVAKGVELKMQKQAVANVLPKGTLKSIS